MPATLIGVPQDIEAETLLEGFKRKGYSVETKWIGKLECRLISELDTAVAVCGHGKAQFALQTQHLIEHSSDAERLFCVGAAGRLYDSLKLGDVVVGVPTVEHDFKLRFVRRPLPRHQPDPNLLQEFTETAQSGNFSFGVHFGPIASGDEDIVDPVQARELIANTGALCAAWEGSGGARAARFNKLPFLEIRCLTDGADADARASFHESVDRVMPNIAGLLIEWQSTA